MKLALESLDRQRFTENPREVFSYQGFIYN